MIWKPFQLMRTHNSEISDQNTATTSCTESTIRKRNELTHSLYSTYADVAFPPHVAYPENDTRYTVIIKHR